MTSSGPQLFIYRLLLFIAILLIWAFFTGDLNEQYLIVDPIFLPPPTAVVRSLVNYFNDGLFWTDGYATMVEALLGLAFGMLSGALCGLILGFLPIIARIFEPVLVAFNSLPRITIAPLLIIWFGLGLTSKVLLSLFTVFFVILFNTYAGVKSVEQEYLRMVRILGGSATQALRYVILPSVASWIFAALRTCVSFALTGAVVGEFVGSTAGYGYRLLLASGVMDTAQVFAIMFILMVIGTVLTLSAARFERYLLRWNPKYH